MYRYYCGANSSSHSEHLPPQAYLQVTKSLKLVNIPVTNSLRLIGIRDHTHGVDYDFSVSMGLLLLLFLLMRAGSGHSRHNISTVCDNIVNGQGVWLMVESTRSGLCNQLTAVYAFIPFALSINASLIVGPMYSRLNFEVRYRVYTKQQNKQLPFSDFFDWKHFQDTWRPIAQDSKLHPPNAIQMVQLQDVQHCLPAKSSPRMIEMKRPRWGMFTDEQILTSFLPYNHLRY